jgi:MoaA/NifB/PqqE/SkfB family radical SAM enzyme
MIPAATRIHSAFLHVTNACNLRCVYCYSSAGAPLSNELTTDEWRGIFPDLVALGPRKVIVTGGEPLCRADTLDLIGALRDADPGHTVTRCLNTNGLLVTRAVARQLMDLVDEVRVSVDALAPAHDAARGQGTWQAAIDALELLYSLGFEPKVMVTVTRASLPDLEMLLRVLRAKKLTRINVNVFRPIGRGAGRADWFITPAEFQRATRDAVEKVFPGERLHGDENGGDAGDADAPMSCVAGEMLNITPDGTVFPCHVLTQPLLRLGNVRQRRLREICAPGELLCRIATGELAATVSPHACPALFMRAAKQISA